MYQVEDDEEDQCHLFHVSFDKLVETLKRNPYEYEIGATYDMMSRNIQHYSPLFDKILFAFVEEVQLAENYLLSLLPDNHQYNFKQNGRYPYRGAGYVYLIGSFK